MPLDNTVPDQLLESLLKHSSEGNSTLRHIAEATKGSSLLSQKSPSAHRSRMTVVENVYYQPQDETGVVTETRFCRWLNTDEQVYGPRRIVSGEEWKPLDCGWINLAGMLVVSNEEGKHLQTMPTEDERASTQSRIIELGMVGTNETLAFAQIRPGESHRLEPMNLARYVIRCRKGKARALVTVFPQ